MKNMVRFFGFIVSLTVIGFTIAGCGDGGGGGGGGGDLDLGGTIIISPINNVTTGKELTATYIGTETAALAYQWKKDGTNVGTNSTKYTPISAGSYTVTVSATGYKSKTSAAVTVTGQTLSLFAGDVTISPSGNVISGTELTAAYSGSESVTLTYQWRRGDANVGTNSTKYTPTSAGSYTVIVSAAGYAPKPSAAVSVDAWTVVTNSNSPFTASDTIQFIAYSNNKFIAWGSSGMSGGKMVTSSDGVSWTSVPDLNNLWSNKINGIAWGDGKFVAVGTYGRMAYSSDGVTWNKVDDPKFGQYSDFIFGIAYGNGKFVAVGEQGKISTSSDGVTWTAETGKPFGDTNNVTTIAYGDGKFVVGGGKGKIAYSSDGVTWAPVADIFNDSYSGSVINLIVWGKGKFVAGSSSGKMEYSSDGVTWTPVADNPINNDIRGIAGGSNKFFAVSSTKTAYSSDCVTWTVADDNSTFRYNSIYGIAYGDGKFVAVCASGRIAYLSDN